MSVEVVVVVFIMIFKQKSVNRNSAEIQKRNFSSKILAFFSASSYFIVLLMLLLFVIFLHCSFYHLSIISGWITHLAHSMFITHC